MQFRFIPADHATGRYSRTTAESKYTEAPSPTKTSLEATNAQTWSKSALADDKPARYVSASYTCLDGPKLLSADPALSSRFRGAMGLNPVRQGEDLFVSRDGEGLRMLGAVYSMKQCVTCHGGARGDLLGAFSYLLLTNEP